MAFRIITADERLKERNGIKGVIFGPAKIGKTSLLWTLDPATTLFLDLEAGDLSVQGWQGDSAEIRDWPTARNLACYLGGPDPAKRSEQAYSQSHYLAIEDEFAGLNVNKYQTIFIDSITVAGRLSFQWASAQPEAFSERTGKPDTRGAYGLHGREMIAWITQLQHIPNKNVWFVGLLDEKRDEMNRVYFEPQIEGSKTGLELPGIVDQVITMTELSAQAEEGQTKTYRAFVCSRPNPWGFPAGDRSGKLSMVEKPHLGALMQKIKTGARINPQDYIYSLEGQENGK